MHNFLKDGIFCPETYLKKRVGNELLFIHKPHMGLSKSEAEKL